MTKLLIYGVIALAVVGAITATIAGIYHHGYSAGSAAKQLDWDAANKAQREKEAKQVNTASTSLEADRASAKVVYRTITETVDKIVDRPVYRNVCLDDDGLRLARCAIRGEGADSCKPDGAVRPATRSTGRDRGLSLTLDYGSFGHLSGLRGQAQEARRSGEVIAEAR